MRFHDVEIHNAAELIAVDEKKAVLPQRVPEYVRRALNPRAQERVRNPDNVEIRFRCDGTARLTVSSLQGQTVIIPFWGDFQVNTEYVIDEHERTIEIGFPENLAAFKDAARYRKRFSMDLLRLVCTGRSSNLLVHAIDGDGISPPREDDLPGHTLLTYGTSITHGNAAVRSHLSYAAQTARLAGVDLINLGVGGSCVCEAEFADYIADRDDWSVCLLSISVNMIGGGFTVAEFHERALYMINRIAERHSTKPVVCVSIYPHHRELFDLDGDDAHLVNSFRHALRDAVVSSGHTNVTFVEGPSLLRDITGLTADLIHPSDNGMFEIAQGLAPIVLERLRESQGI